MTEDQWISKNINQRRCEVFSPYSNAVVGRDDVDGGKHMCKCRRTISKHPDPQSKSDVWSMSKNTRPVPCKDFGTIQFGNEKTSKFVRLDVETPMSVVKTLLLNIWKLPEPKWIISVIGDKTNENDSLLKEAGLETNMKKVIRLFSKGRDMWITCDGVNVGVSEVIGGIIDKQHEATLVGICGWSVSEKDTRLLLKSKENGDDDPYKLLLQWAVRSDHQKCAALFWKKGKDLLASALEMSAELRMMDPKENIGQRKVRESHSVLFQQRALGLINECYNNNKENTMKLIQRQGKDNIWIESASGNSAQSNNQVLERCFEECNRKIFGTDAMMNYIKKVLYGLTNPPNMDTPISISTKENGETSKILKTVLAPLTTYSLNLIFYVAFLVLFGQTLLFELGKTFSPSEGILFFWWFALAVEECRQLWNTAVPTEENTRCQIFGAKLKGYFLDNYWNILDCVCLLFFLVGGVLMTIYHVDNTREDIYQAARLFLSLDIMFFTWKLLQFLAMNSKIGPVLVMIHAMIIDVLPFLTIMFVFIISQGLATHALLYPNRDWSPRVLIYIPKNAFWNIFGELGLEETQAQEPDDCSSDPLLYKNGTRAECPSVLGYYAVPFLLGVYMLLMNVLLLNIVIARFSFTFGEIHEQTKSIAAWQRARVILEYYKKPPLPPPLNVFYHLGYYIYCLFCCCQVPDVVSEKSNDERELAAWERSMAELYLASAEFKSGSERISISASKVQSTSLTPTSETAAKERSSTQTEGLKELREEVNTSQKELHEIKLLLKEIKEKTQPSKRSETYYTKL